MSRWTPADRDRERNRTTDRGQAHTLEAFVAALLLVSAVLFALQATAVTPLSASTSNQHIENQQRAEANDVLAIAAERGDLEAAVLCWDESQGGFNGSSLPTGAYSDGIEQDTAGCGSFGAMLEETFGDRQVAYSVHIIYQNSTAQTKRQPLISMGDPSDSAVAASRTVPLFANDRVLAGEQTRLDETSLYQEDRPDQMSYPTQVTVEVVVWRM